MAGYDKLDVLFAIGAVMLIGFACGSVIFQITEVLTVDGLEARVWALIGFAMSSVLLVVVYQKRWLSWARLMLEDYHRRNWSQRTLYVFFDPENPGEIREVWGIPDDGGIPYDSPRPRVKVRFGAYADGGEPRIKLYGANKEWHVLQRRRGNCLTFARVSKDSYEEFTLPYKVALARIARGCLEADLLGL